MAQGTATLQASEVLTPMDLAVLDVIGNLEDIGDADSMRSAERLRLQLSLQRRAV